MRRRSDKVSLSGGHRGQHSEQLNPEDSAALLGVVAENLAAVLLNDAEANT